MITALKDAGFVDAFLRMLILAYQHLFDLVLVIIACWAVIKLQKEPKRLWWLLAAIGAQCANRGFNSTAFWLIAKYYPTAFSISTSGPSPVLMALSFISIGVSMIGEGLKWWCLWQACFAEQRLISIELNRTAENLDSQGTA